MPAFTSETSMPISRSAALPILFLALSACTGGGIRGTEARVRIENDADLNADEGWGDPAGRLDKTPSRRRPAGTPTNKTSRAEIGNLAGDPYDP